MIAPPPLSQQVNSAKFLHPDDLHEAEDTP